MNKLPDRAVSGKTCPNCGVNTMLIVRTNRDNGRQFLGCPNFPECTYHEGIPESTKMRLMGQPELDFMSEEGEIEYCDQICPVCNGSGEVGKYYDHCGEGDEICTTCGGSGYV